MLNTPLHFFWRRCWLVIVALFVVTVVLCLTVTAFSYGFIVTDEAELESAEAVMILGAGVYSSGELTPILQARVDKALSIYRAGLVNKILVSGDNSTPTYNEVVPVKVYLLASGVAESDIFLDYAGFDTYDSMYRARDVFEVESVIIVTQSFHLPRAVFTARMLGLDVEGIAPAHDMATWYNHSREVPARAKAIVDVLLGSQPTYLGETIPISGDGRATSDFSE